MTTRCDVCKLIRTLSTVISTMYLTPSVIDGILRAFFAFIVHPTDGDAQITTLYYYMYIQRWFFSFPYQMSITKAVSYSNSFVGLISSFRKNSLLSVVALSEHRISPCQLLFALLAR